MLGTPVGTSDYILTGKTLGKGTYGTVEEGKHKDTGKYVAVKYLCYKQVGTEKVEAEHQQVAITSEESINREVDLQIRVKHPNVLNVLDVQDVTFSSKAGNDYLAKAIIMERARNENLHTAATLHYPRTLHETVVRTYFRQLIECLAFCHGQGVAHRDLKPENLMIDYNYALKIGDFGEGKVMDANNDFLTNTANVGSEIYRAPEVMNYDSNDGQTKGYDPRISDMWSCGVILFGLLSGVPPMKCQNTSCLYFKTLSTQRLGLFWSNHRHHYFPLAVKDLLNRMLEPDPSKRITIAGVRAHPWYNETVLGASTLATEMKKFCMSVNATETIAHHDKAEESQDESSDDEVILQLVGHRGGPDEEDDQSDLEASDDEGDNKDDLSEDGDTKAMVEDETPLKFQSIAAINAPTPALNQNVDLYGDSDEDESDDEDEKREFKSAPAVFDLLNRTVTCFESASTLSSLHRSAQKAVESSPQGTAYKEGEFSWLVEAKEGGLSAMLTIYAHPECGSDTSEDDDEESDEPRFMVELHRLSGKNVDFSALYIHIVRKMQSRIFIRPNEDDEDE